MAWLERVNHHTGDRVWLLKRGDYAATIGYQPPIPKECDFGFFYARVVKNRNRREIVLYDSWAKAWGWKKLSEAQEDVEAILAERRAVP